jgi:hypothetical protein
VAPRLAGEAAAFVWSEDANGHGSLRKQVPPTGTSRRGVSSDGPAVRTVVRAPTIDAGAAMHK